MYKGKEPRWCFGDVFFISSVRITLGCASSANILYLNILNHFGQLDNFGLSRSNSCLGLHVYIELFEKPNYSLWLRISCSIPYLAIHNDHLLSKYLRNFIPFFQQPLNGDRSYYMYLRNPSSIVSNVWLATFTQTQLSDSVQRKSPLPSNIRVSSEIGTFQNLEMVINLPGFQRTK